jgi:uncharacterized integral membrane protein
MSYVTAEELLKRDEQENAGWKWSIIYVGLFIILILVIVLLALKNYNLI